MTAQPMTDLRIPPEALEAGARAIYTQRYGEKFMTFDDAPVWTQDNMREQARACFLAMIEAWPGVQTGSDDGGITLSGIYIPLTETPDDKA